MTSRHELRPGVCVGVTMSLKLGESSALVIT